MSEDKRKGELSFARCEVCLQHDGWAKTTDNLMLVAIDGRTALVCRKHNPDRELRKKYEKEEPRLLNDVPKLRAEYEQESRAD
jgi:hypothetical protein